MLNDDDFSHILRYFDRPWAGYRKVRKGVKKRIRRHMTELGCNTVETYLQILSSHPEARMHCEQRLLVTISRFFRDNKLWPYLQACIMPELANRFHAPIRIWSAGCACGEEPYSLAIAWQSLAHPPPLELLATDINADCLAHARHGIYNQSSLKEVSEAIRTRYFTPRRGGRQYTLQQHLLPPIHWHQHHLMDPPPAGRFQMILLRNNLLTYHQGEILKTTFQQIIQALSPEGYLIIGSHEHPPESKAKALLNQDPQCPWIYKKIEQDAKIIVLRVTCKVINH